MITTKLNLTAEQEAEYQALFEKMGDYAGKEIHSLHDYLSALDDLMKEMKTSLNANTYNLLRLPLTEPVFEINPDTREISVPKQFKENGLTIQGDKLAEIVWFKMPRFFDLTDFYNFKNDGVPTNSDFEDYHTYIEWYNPSGKDDHQKGVDLAYAMTCDEDYVYFGWPLADKVSGDAGTIQFTVRFLGVKDGKIQYNFSTKIQSCVIKATLNFDLLSKQYTADSWEDLIYSRPVYSGVVDSFESYAPIILQGLVDGKQDLEYHPATEAQGTEGEDDYVPAQAAYYSLPLNVKAASPNKTGITQSLCFVWQWQVGSMSGLAEVPNSTVTEQVVDADLESDTYAVAKQSTFTVNQVGRYTVYIGNKIDDQEKIRYVYTGVVEVPKPTMPDLNNTSMPSKGYTSTITKNQFDGAYYGVETILAVDVKNHVDGDEIVYQWKREVVTGKDAVGNFTTEVQNVPANEGGTSSSINPDAEGIYWAEVKTTRNGAESEAVESSKCDLRNPPQNFAHATGTVILTYDEETRTFTASLKDQINIAHKVAYVWKFIPSAGRVDSDNLPEKEEFQKGGENGVALNNNTLVAPYSGGTYVVDGYEVVFDTEEDTTNAHYMTKTIYAQRAVSQEITLTDDFKVYELDGGTEG